MKEKIRFENLIEANPDSPNYGKTVEIEIDGPMNQNALDYLEEVWKSARESAERLKRMFS